MLSWRFSLCGRAHLPRRSLLILFGAFVAAGCGGPTNPQTLGPILVCPANLTVHSLDGNASPVIYEAPQVVAGEPPLRTKCSPESGAVFLVGASTVTCTTTDAVGRTSSCAFTVTVDVPPRISATSFVAFGNSVTEGKLASGTLAKSYPENLRELLTARYASQTIVVVNAGCGGESTVAGGLCTGGVVRLPAVLDTIHPEVLLLEEGINDLSGGSASAIQPMIDALRTMVRDAKGRGIAVFLETLPPEREGGSRAGAFPAIPEANHQIRLLALSEHVTLVDLYEGFGGNPDPYIDTDGLHPTELGYQKIAQLVFDVIRMSLELKPGVASAMELVRNMPPARQPRWGGVPSQNPLFMRIR
jgi:lysophospholipase L1-like esterase